MMQISSLFLFASLALVAAEDPYLDIQLITDASRRYLINAQIGIGDAAQDCNFALTTSTPFLAVAGVGCSDCGGVNSYDQNDSTTFQALGNSAGVNLIGNTSTSGPLIKEHCSLHMKNGSSWDYPNQTMIMSNQSASVYGGDVSGLFGLASGRATNNLNVSVIGGIFSRQPELQSFTFGLVLEPPNADHSANAGTLHWLGTDSDAYDGDITWKLTTVSSNSDLATFEIDGWQFNTGDTIITNSNQDLDSTVDPYYVNTFFPSQDAQAIHAAIQGSSSGPANDGQSTVYVVPCNSVFSLSTTIGGQVWRLDQALLVQKQGDGTCVSNIQGWTDTSNRRYLFGSAFLSSLYVAFQVGNPNSAQSDQIGFARRANPSSIVGPIVGGVVGGLGGIVIISLAIFFWIRRRARRKLNGVLDSEDRGGNVEHFIENKDVQPFPFTAQPTNVPPISPAAFAYASAYQPPAASQFTEGVPKSPNVNDPLLFSSYDPTYLTGPSSPSQQQQLNPFPGHTSKN